ncbi:hypothetical protein BO94DRAFT_20622 [Aspergillus sclerotioniger CBS 115572]|uniref:Uncharacterized protein n=1 Tax=Aspergillus sclerotioniger CBS 115572 TaxID=1450535 RepID=A0A317XEY2_9EURO|nr:hypothetical protein BO94DRAFT_20622 [Aspergillus sclerotioniger CBS 115572]PWY96801.1 hypothetical protein BO94DRAFT_20622 [Aspergillus sclerotioniger CBS 115572]
MTSLHQSAGHPRRTLYFFPLVHTRYLSISTPSPFSSPAGRRPISDIERESAQLSPLHSRRPHTRTHCSRGGQPSGGSDSAGRAPFAIGLTAPPGALIGCRKGVSCALREGRHRCFASSDPRVWTRTLPSPACPASRTLAATSRGPFVAAYIVVGECPVEPSPRFRQT